MSRVLAERFAPKDVQRELVGAVVRPRIDNTLDREVPSRPRDLGVYAWITLAVHVRPFIWWSPSNVRRAPDRSFASAPEPGVQGPRRRRLDGRNPKIAACLAYAGHGSPALLPLRPADRIRPALASRPPRRPPRLPRSRPRNLQPPCRRRKDERQENRPSADLVAGLVRADPAKRHPQRHIDADETHVLSLAQSVRRAAGGLRVPPVRLEPPGRGMLECSICGRSFDDCFRVFAPPHPEPLDRIECARRAAAAWGADERVAPPDPPSRSLSRRLRGAQ